MGIRYNGIIRHNMVGFWVDGEQEGVCPIMMKKIFSRKNVALAILIFASGTMYFVSDSYPQDAWQVISDTQEEQLEESEWKSSPSDEEETNQEIFSENTNPQMGFVHLAGAVVSPGVYQVEEGSRIYQVIDLAGGLTEEADKEFLNMAQTVTDGQKIVVYTKEEVEEGKISETVNSITSNGAALDEAKINLNTADKDTLMKLAGIGEAKADAILAYRTEHGGFRTIEEIMEVPGIKSAAFEKIKDDIIV